MPHTKLHIAILDCDTPVPNVYAERGLYSDIFAVLLRNAVENLPELPALDLQFSKYDCVVGQLPSNEELLQMDVIIITGSASPAASAYDPAPWILSLASFIKDLYTLHPNIKIFGSCFGHQLLCHALFSTTSTAVVTRDPAGWELGIQPITLSPPFLSHYGSVASNTSSRSQLRLQFVHADHVVLTPNHLKDEGFESIGRSDHCGLQGVWKRGRVLTYQGHAEFDPFINGETLKVFGKPIWSAERLREALKSVEGDDDAVWAASVMLRFFLETGFEDIERANGEESEMEHEEEAMAML